MSFGKELREKAFGFGEGVLPVNHGSFGVAPTEVLKERENAMREEVAFPDKAYAFQRGMSEPPSVATRKVFAENLDCDFEDVVCVQNATTGVNAVLRSVPWEKGDKILLCSSAYVNCLNTLKFLEDRYGVSLVRVQLSFPMSDDEIVKAYVDAAKKEKVNLALFDTVSSMPGVRMPWETITKELKDLGVLTLVDGAHGLGIIDISLRTVQPDFFVTNAHKWYYAAHSVAAFYVDKKHQPLIANLPVSVYYFPVNDAQEVKGNALQRAAPQESDKFALSFVHAGTTDTSAVKSVVTADKFVKSLGLDKIIAYQNDLAKRASEHLCKELGVPDINEASKYPQRAMAMFTLVYPVQPPANKQQELVNMTQDFFLHERETFIPLGIHDGKIHIRFSAAPYLEFDDFVRAGEIVKEAVTKWNNAQEQ